MFFKCPKCQKTWQYPIEKCPHCFSELERVCSKEAKVIGVSKTMIPTLLHPKVPYWALVLEDENHNKWVEKVTEEYEVGDVRKYPSLEGEIRLKEGVAVWRVKYDALEAIEKIVYFLGDIKVGPDFKILILPTIVSPKHPYFGENTSPPVLSALIKLLFQKGVSPQNIKVAAQSFNEIPIEASVQKSQLFDVCLQNKVAPLNLSETKFIKKEKDGFDFEISEEVFNNDLIISLSIFKMDAKKGVIGAAENVFKLLKKESYLSLKYLHNEEEIAVKFNEVLPEILSIAEAIIVQKPDKFTGFLGLMLGSFNTFNLDRVFSEITMRNSLPEYLKKNLIEEIPIAGRSIGEVQYDVEKYS